MVNVTIDGKRIQVREGTTIMDAAARCRIPIPSLCYLKDINEIAACRVCVVELEGKERLITSCNNVVDEGMVLYTNSTKVRRHRRRTVEGTGSRVTINVSGRKTIEEADCSLCGQCITHCPVGALTARDDTEREKCPGRCLPGSTELGLQRQQRYPGGRI